MNEVAENRTRNSSIELLRIICMFGIISMHTFGDFAGSCTGINLIYGTFINSVFNMGVTIFMLITGYFGAKPSAKKIISLEMMIWFYSFAGLMISSICCSGFSVIEFFKACLPIATKKYWYMSVYMVILCLSGFLNKIPEKLSKKDMQVLLTILIVFFYIMPTFTYFQIMEDSGKGLANMLTVYLLGRYLHKYHDVKRPAMKTLVVAFVAIFTIFTVNLTASYVTVKGVGIRSPWARDNSLFILIGAVFIFLFFKNITFYSRFLNLIASCVLGIYLFEGTMRNVLDYFFDLSLYADSGWLFAISAMYVILVMVICCVIELLRKFTVGRLDKYVYQFIKGIYENCSVNKYFKSISKSFL